MSFYAFAVGGPLSSMPQEKKGSEGPSSRENRYGGGEKGGPFSMSDLTGEA